MTGQHSRPAILAREVTTHILGPLVGFLEHDPAVSGREHLDALSGPFIVCANHASHFDVSTRRFLAGWLGAFPFRQAGSGADPMAQLERLLGKGWNIVLFPEGTRTRTREMTPFKPRIGLVAAWTGRPVLPACIRGTYEVLPPGRWLPRRGRVEVRFGPPLIAGPGEDPRAFTARLEGVIPAL